MGDKIINITNLKYYNDKINETKQDVLVSGQNIKTVNGESILGEGDMKLENSILPLTYNELVALRDNAQLIPGQQYRITDYVTTTIQENTQSAGHQFDVIVTADDESTLNEVARAIQHDGDTYFADSNLNVWQIWYCIDNDTNKFEWADATNGKGVIYRMIDEFNNDCPYDFKNIQFKHPNDTTTYPDFYYTFSTVIDDTVTDHSMLKGYCYSNAIKEYIKSKKQSLNNNVFLNTSETRNCYDNTFGNGCHNNSFGDKCYDNTFGNSCYSNSFGNNCYDNSFGNSCYSNSFGNRYESNSFGNRCYSNSFGNNCRSNSFGNSCYFNTFGMFCRSNSFGYECYSNSFGDACTDNSFGNSCWSNSFGDACTDNSFGNSCWSNSFGDDCSNNTFEVDCTLNSFGNNCQSNSFGNNCQTNFFGNSFSYNSFGNGCSLNSFRISADETSSLKDYVKYNHFDDGCFQNVIWNSDTTSSSILLKNINVNKGVVGIGGYHTYINIDVLNQGYEIQVAKNSNGEIKIYCEADLIA